MFNLFLLFLSTYEHELKKFAPFSGAIQLKLLIISALGE